MTGIEKIIEEIDNGAWLPVNALPARWMGGAVSGNLYLTKQYLVFEPRNKDENRAVELPIDDIISIKREDELGNGSGFSLQVANDPIGLFFKVKNPAEWIRHFKINESNDEMKNTCNRCGKFWFLESNELEDLEARLRTVTDTTKDMSKVSLLATLFDPMLSAQMNTTDMVATRGVQDLQKELNEKYKCPECNSKNIKREIVDADATVSKEIVKKDKAEDGNLVDELKKLNELKEQGILDEEEFKMAKKKLIGNHSD